jgi:hypothetical protein
MSAKLKLFALAIGSVALVSTPALAAWHHNDRSTRGRDIESSESAYAYAPAGQGITVMGPTMYAVRNHIPVGGKQLPGFNAKP